MAKRNHWSTIQKSFIFRFPVTLNKTLLFTRPKILPRQHKRWNSRSLSSLSTQVTLFLSDLPGWPWVNHLTSSSLTLHVDSRIYSLISINSKFTLGVILNSYLSHPTLNPSTHPMGDNFKIFSEANHFSPLVHPGLPDRMCILGEEHIAI